MQDMLLCLDKQKISTMHHARKFSAEDETRFRPSGEDLEKAIKEEGALTDSFALCM